MGTVQAAESTFEMVGMPVPVFKVGPPSRPKIVHDDGHLGKFAPRKPTAADLAELRKWIARLEAGEAIQGLPFLPHNDIPDALAAYRHFLFGEGRDRRFLYDRYVQNDPSGKVTVENAIFQAQSAAESLYAARKDRPGGHVFEMTSSVIPCGADPDDSPWGEFFPYPQTENWQKTVGAHFIWLSASVNVSTGPLRPTFVMTFNLHAEDRYNFNPGDQDIATGIPDSANGRFELAGLGRQYTNLATLTRMIRWTGGAFALPPESLVLPNRRQRQPNDNRRLRNRV